MTHGLHHLINLANKLGIDVRLGSNTEFKTVPVTWTIRGSGFRAVGQPIMTLEVRATNLLVKKRFYSAEDVAAKELSHELGHYIAAPKHRRHHVDFGIKSKSGFAESDEYKAQFVDRELRRRFDLPRRIIHPRGDKDYKKAQDWWFSEGEKMVDTLLDFLL